MNVISYKAIKEFIAKHTDAETALKAWFKTAKRAQWKNLVEVRATYPTADLVGDIIVFNIKGNNYRLITYINFQYKQVLIKAVLTHEEYDRERWKK